MTEDKLNAIVLLPLCADAYTLGGHWVYDSQEIKNSNLDMDTLNNPLTSYHKEKKAGDFTHYGDKTLWLLESIHEHDKFLLPEFSNTWQEKIQNYDGYVDGASSKTLLALQEGESALNCGSPSDDFNIVGQIGPIIYKHHENIAVLNENIKLFTLFTHMNKLALQSTQYTVEVVMALLNGQDLVKSILDTSNYHGDEVKVLIDKAKEKFDNDTKETSETIKEFGLACPIEQSLTSSIYLILKYENDYDTLMRENVLAGGDSSARAMFISLLIGAHLGWRETCPLWINDVKNYEKVCELIDL